MGKLLVITEKPSVARDVCEALGGFEAHDKGEWFESDDYVVTFALGHLLELAEPEDYDEKWKGWTIASLPILPERFEVRPREGQKKRLDLIKKLGQRKDVEGVVNACDAGREGEIIFRRIAEYTGLDQLPMQRLWLQSMTEDAIREAFVRLRPGAQYDDLAAAAWLRGVGDWLIGMNTTRALTKRLKGKKEKGAWSAGRVQTPTLNLLVGREREILAHRPRTYWEIVGTFAHEGRTWEGRYHDRAAKDEDDRDVRASRVFDRARVDAVVKALQAAPTGVAGEKRRKSRQSPPLPFDLTTLQREANKRFSFSAKRTLNAAQRLYEGAKVLTYPRTDSRHLPSDWGATLVSVLQSLGQDAAYQGIVGRIDAQGPQNLERVLDGSKVTDHFAIVPTGKEPPADLSGDDARIYDLVVRQFLAALMGPAVWDTVEREVEVAVPGGDAAVFRTTARSLEVPGFLEALGQEEGAGTRLPSLVEGKDDVDGVKVAVEGVADEEKETRPPARLNESQLLRLMETAGEMVEEDELSEAMKDRGLGTPATRADIIERLVETGYARRVEGKVGPTPKGMRLMEVLERAHVPALASPKLTGQWEYELQQVQQGRIKRDEELGRLVDFTREVTGILTTFEHDQLFASEPPLGTCPSCRQGQVIETVWGYRCTRNDREEPGGCQFILWKDRGGRYIDRDTARALVQEGKAGPLFGFVDRFGRELEGSITLVAEEDRPGAPMEMRIDYGNAPAASNVDEVRGGVVFACPCGEPSCEGVVETNLRFVCQRVLDGQAKAGPQLPKVVCQRPIELEEAAAYFGAEGKTPFLTNFTSKRNRPFTGQLVRKPTGKHGFEFLPREERPRRGRGAPAAAEEGAAEAKPARKGKAAAAEKPAKTEKPAKKPAAKKAAAKKPAAKKAAAGAKAAEPKAPARRKASTTT